MNRRRRLLAGIRLAAGSALCCLTACASAPGSAPRSASSPPAASLSRAPNACAARSAPAVPVAGPASALPIDLLLGGMANPDDLLVNDDRVYVGDLSAGRIRVLSSGLDPATLPWSMPTVEGMAMLDGVLYAADQGGDRVNAISAGGLRTVVQLRPVAGVDGVDNIGSTPAALVVPDSARGTVEIVSPDGRTLRTIGGFARPTGALLLADGSLLVADENAGEVVSVAATGARRVVATGLAGVDDVAVDGGGAQFAVTERASGRLVRLAGGRAVEIAGSLGQPQGLAVDGGGNLLVTESTAGRVELVLRTFRALPFAAPQPRGPPLCLEIQRAAGFTGDLRLDAAPGVTILEQPGRGSVARVSLQGCMTPCRLTARSGALESTVWLAALAP